MFITQINADFHGLIGGLLYSLPLRLPSELTDSALKRRFNHSARSQIFKTVYL